MKFEWEPIGCVPSVDKEIGMGTMISFNNPEAEDGIDWVCFQTDVVNAKLPQTYAKLILKDDYIPGRLMNLLLMNLLLMNPLKMFLQLL